MAIDIVGIGNPVMDLVVNVPFMPPKDGSVGAREMFHQGGGKISTGMVACARLGAKAGVLARVGGDFTGDFIISDFAYNGVDTSHILRGAPDTFGPYCVSLSEEETGTRIFIGRGNNVPHLTPEEVNYGYIAHAKCILLENGDDYSVAAAVFAKENGIIVAVDGDQYTEPMEKMLPWVDIFIGSEFYYNKRFGNLGIRESCEAVLAMGPSVAWFTLGAKGCVGLVDGQFYELPSFPVKVRDSTGAGDVFHGAYLAALLEGMPHPECARYAGAVSAIKCTYVGGRTGIPSRETVRRFLRDGVIETRELDERLEYYRASFGKGLKAAF